MNKFLLITVVGACALAGAAYAQQPPAAPSPPMGFNGKPLGDPGKPAHGPSLDLALEAARAAIATCKADGFLVGASVVDSTPEIKVSLAPDGAPGVFAFVSARKAASAVVFKMPITEVGERAKTDKDISAKLAGDHYLMSGHGGIPLMVNGQVVGAVGVSGVGREGPSTEEDKCAQAGVDKIKDRLK